MKLAEALVLRADHQRRIEQLRARLVRNAKVQDGEAPAESPAALLTEFDAMTAELIQLIRRINLTNAATTIGARSMTEALATRDVLKIRHAAYRDLAEAGTITHAVVTRSEVRYKPTINVAEIQRAADAIARELRELDARIQEANWLTELQEG
jgi:hypothetical protein